MESKSFPRIIIAAQRGGAGKTLCTIGILSALKASGFKVVPFKKGPDYIDAGWLSFAAGTNCYNLDPFFMEDEIIVSSFLTHATEGDIAVIEGNRGLFDGVDIEGICSTARLARLLKAPIILVLDCTKVTRTLAAFVKGCQIFEPNLDIVGVILNQIARTRHERIIRECIEKYTGIEVIGAIPRIKDLAFPMRHLGLLPWQEHQSGERVIEILKKIFLKYIDIQRLFDFAKAAPPLEGKTFLYKNPSSFDVTIGIFRDPAFQFYYPENIASLISLGAKIVEFNSLYLRRLPSIDAIYIGGGFPETQAKFLADNYSLRQDLKEAIEDGLPVYAECGGLMYLGREIHWHGKKYPMVGAIPVDFEVKERPQGHGYVVCKVVTPNPFYPVGTFIRGHEFHYSRPVNVRENGLSFAFALEKGHGFGNKKDGVLYRNILGAYTHVHALGVREWAKGIIERAKKYKNQNYTLHSKRKEVEEEKNERRG